ncbi:MAG TPA: aconitate hydratase AcnA [Kiritimatiellia bacterium]|nr:aconitate hydratase AcnA [Kiritimatiellia bacterium]
MSQFDYALQSLTLTSGKTVHFYSLPALEKAGLVKLARLPYSIRVVLESLVRYQGHPAFTPEHVTGFAKWSPKIEIAEEFPYQPARVLLQDFTGVPCIADLAALRSAMERAGKNPAKIEPQIPVDLVIDHSVQVDTYETADSFQQNVEKEFERNSERYVFLRWGQGAFHKLRIVPPGLGICHQVNLEYLAQGVMTVQDAQGRTIAFPDTLVGTDSHTTMINGLGVLGWGVGGIEAEAAMLGQPIPLVSPKVTGVRVVGKLPAGATATDFALAVTTMLRKVGVVEQFVEFFGPGVSALSLADRATVANMAPEYGATMGFFPIDAETLRYLRETGRSDEQVELVEKYCKAQGLFRTDADADPEFSQVVEIDLSTLQASVAGPKRPQDRLFIGEVKSSFAKALTAPVKERGFGLPDDKLKSTATADGIGELRHGSVVVAAITSCTNTSNPHVLLAAGLIAQKAVARGLTVPSYVKTSLAPGSRVVTAYLRKAGLLEPLAALNFHVVAYGCTTCIGNSGPLDARVEKAIKDGDIVAAAVLSGNRNFEGRVHPLTKANYLCSPPLVVAYALAGRVDIDLTTEPLGTGSDGKPVFLKDLWPSEDEIKRYLALAADPATYRTLYTDIAESNPLWNALAGGGAPVYTWNTASTYIQEPPFLHNLPENPQPLSDLNAASVLAVFGDFITTDHISPAGSIPKSSPAGKYLIANGVKPEDFNSYGARRGNHEVMMRGTFANIRIKNEMMGGQEGGNTIHQPTGETMSIYDAAMKYIAAGTPLVVLAGKMYGAGSSRDWAAKGTYLLGVKAVIAESFERIHRSNLVEMGVLPLEFTDGQTAASLGLTGKETFSISGIADGFTPGKLLTVVAEGPGGRKTLIVKARVDSAVEIDYLRHGGILPYVLRGAMA